MRTMSLSSAVGASLILILAARAAAAEPFQVELSVTESAGMARRQEPISGGVPLPRGRLRADQPFALFRADGRELPCQTRPLVVETDGTLRWVLLDFQDDLPAGTTAKYVLKAARPSAAPARLLRIHESPQAVTVDTGVVQFAVSRKKPFALLDSVAVGGKEVLSGAGVSYTQLQGRKGWDDPAKWSPLKLQAGPPESVTVQYAGPMRATIQVKGRFADDPSGASYQAWITAWAGQGRLLVKYKLCNSNADQYTAILVRDSTIELKLAQPQGIVLGGQSPIPAGTSGWIYQGLLPSAPGACRAGRGEQALWTSAANDRPGGWIAGTGGAVWFVWDRLFWTNPARRLEVAAGRLLLQGIAPRLDGPLDPNGREGRRIGQPYQAQGFWLYDCSHHSSEYVLDFAPPAELDQLARACHDRLWVLAPPSHYAECGVMGGPAGSLDDEQAAYKAWGWSYDPKQATASTPRVAAGSFVGFEDNHYESEADSVEALLLMYVRTGRRAWLDLGEAWARYHTDLQAWRSDLWAWKDGAIWFPSGGPQGNMQVRRKWNFGWGPNWGSRQKDPDCADLWRHAQAKSCYCHFYGSGLADFFCLTGDADALEAARDDVQQKDDEFRRYRKFQPGTSQIGDIRGFGRGFEVMMRVLEADPGNTKIRDLCRLCARTLWQSPMLDERGFHPSLVGGGFGGMPVKELTPAIRKWMEGQGIRHSASGQTVDRLTQGERTWPVVCYGGTWQHVYIQNGADLYARYFDDEDMRDFAIAFAQMSRRYMLSPRCRQTWYYTYFDVPARGGVFDPWALEHTDTRDGEGCVHSGWYTRFYVDACARGFSLTGELPLLAKAREFWYYGSKREYQTKHLSGKPNEVAHFATHVPPKDDTVLSTGRLFYETAHPRSDTQPPDPVTDLAVRLLGEGKAEVRFTAPDDSALRAGAGKAGQVIRYQVKAADLPIVEYDQWDPVQDPGVRRNWWRATNCQGEPAPSAPGSAERFTVTGLPPAGPGKKLHFAVRSFDASNNRSRISNVAASP